MLLLNLAKIDYQFEGFKIHNPSLAELFEIFETEDDLIFCLQIASISLKELLKIKGADGISEFQLFQTLLLSDKNIGGVTPSQKAKIVKLLLLLFPGYEMEILNDRFIFKKDENIILLSDNNFDLFKQILADMFDFKSIMGDTTNVQQNAFDPANEQARKIAEKIEQGRKKIGELKADSRQSIFENYLSVLSVGFGIPITILAEQLNLYTLIKTYKRFVAKIAWDMDIKCRLAGGTPQDSPENWMIMA
jgi:hypothetical protein